ncbi:class II aldolase/adducin family protein [Christensenellaceae bacterium OttesenSCG-928-K19]|nr:class II aldolase/adducin family protein [Christensenellaceae bacterium OttesenSCG-928-K19]
MTKYPSIGEAKEQILEIGRRMYQKGFVAANDGNITCRIGEDVILTTPAGVSKGFMTDDMIIKMTMDGEVLQSEGGYKPSSEVKMHIRAYRENPDIMAVTHAHPPASTSFAIAGIALDKAILPEAVVNLGVVPIAKYANPGSEQVPESIAPFCRDYNAVLLANHGALTWGKSLFEAFYRLESLEYYATVTMYTHNLLGRANILSCGQVEQLLETRKKLGIDAGGVPPCVDAPTNARDVLPAGGVQNSAEDGRLNSLVEQITKSILEKLDDK